MGFSVKKFIKKAGDTLEGARDTVSGTISAATDVIAGRSLDESKAKIGEGFNKTTGSYLDIMSAGYGKEIDLYTGGLYNAAKSSNETAGNLFAGKSIKQNLKDTVRVGAVAAATTYGGVAGGAAVNSQLSKGVNAKSLANAAASYGTGNSFVDNVLKSVGYTPSSQQASPIDENNYFSDSGFTGTGLSQNMKVGLIIGGLGAILFIVIKARK